MALRLDKYLTELGAGTRSEVKKQIKAGLVTVNGAVAKKPEQRSMRRAMRYACAGSACSIPLLSIICFTSPPAVCRRHRTICTAR